MALVAYDNSDSSEYEEDDDHKTEVAILPNATFKKVHPLNIPPPKLHTEKIKLPEEDDKGQTAPSLFNLLPQPSHKKPEVVEEDDEFLRKKVDVAEIVKPKAKITVPSLSDFKDVKDTIPTATAKPRASEKKSGLLSMLPQPKHVVQLSTTSKSFIPHVLTKKPPAKKEPLSAPMKKPNIEKSVINDYSDDSDDDEVQNDFFSIHKKVKEIPIKDVSLDIDVKSVPQVNVAKQKQTRDIQSYFKPESVETLDRLDPNDIADVEYAHPESNETSSFATQENTNSSNAVLDEEAILKLCGTRGKRRREEIQILDVNQQEVLAGAKEMLLKGLMDDTTKRVSVSKRRGNEPTNQQKRKHQITYLAHQAKANEAELQNQWANNRMTKRQTQSKYGF